VPQGSFHWWSKRLADHGVELSGDKLLVRDPDGMRVELIETSDSLGSEFWSEVGIAEQYAIKGIQSIVLALGSFEQSHGLYTNELTFSEVRSADGRKRYSVGESWVELVTPRVPTRGRLGAGSIHHVAFRTDNDASQAEWLHKLNALGLNMSPVMDRKYFHSIYFRERNGVLFEIATDGPGMAVDEAVDHLGEALSLPSEYEPMREVLQRSLEPVVPGRTPTPA
jgi:glyoxalase family protein